ncbi:hypothetical protein GZ77_10150 [Endozoicomonas montiporae]|uniref:histidine kinase n=2 Tax=Endozoicomonas montiporae TaxID=1027273 RepID=A0A081N893_9GAMM|nr:7TM-DISM domain-containing protein [Endozoicomonas montiporae]AMO55446.1 integral membrane sensor signal transduction histidine kinase [Endozoicomonas montiporae CL-33]KEQ14666.1 hypothetical protein GZ77_10150 [Endozoicomonas montiporae]
MSYSSLDGKPSILSTARQALSLFVWLWLIVSSFSYVHADVTIITENTEELNLITVSEYLEDPDSQYTLEEINRPEVDALFKPVQKTVFNKGISESVVWLRFDLRYLSYVGEELGTWLIELAHPPLDLVTIYIEDDWDGFQQLNAGDKFPFDVRLVEYPRLLFPVDIRSGDTLRFYVRIETSGSLYVPLKLWSPLAYIERSSSINISQGMILGALVTLLIFNLIILLRLRSSSYLFFAIHASCFLMYFLSISGIGLQYLWPDSPSLSAGAPRYISASVTSLIMFSVVFLRLGKKAASLNRFLTMLLLLSIFILPVTMLMTYEQAVWLITGQQLLVMPCLMFAGLYIWLVKRDRSARFFFAACLVLMAGEAVYALMIWLKLGGSAFYVNAVPVSGVIGLILLSLGLWSRVRRQRDEWVVTEVNSRQALEKESHRMLEGSRLKAEFLSTLSHELEQPVRYIAEKIQQVEEPGSFEQKELLNNIRKTASEVDELIAYLVSLSDRQEELGQLTEVPFNMQRQMDILKDGVSIVCEDQSVELLFEIADDISRTLYADAEKMSRALRYVIENLVKLGVGSYVQVRVQKYEHKNPEKMGITFSVVGTLKNDDDEVCYMMPKGVWWSLCRQIMHALDGSAACTQQASGEVCFELSLGCRVDTSAS